MKKSKKKQKEEDVVKEGAVPAYLLERQTVSRSKVLSNSVKKNGKSGPVNLPFHYRRSDLSAKMKCSKSSKPENDRKNLGNAW